MAVTALQKHMHPDLSDILQCLRTAGHLDAGYVVSLSAVVAADGVHMLGAFSVTLHYRNKTGAAC